MQHGGMCMGFEIRKTMAYIQVSLIKESNDLGRLLQSLILTSFWRPN